MSQWNLNDVGHFSHVVEISEDIFSFIHCLDNEETECVNVIVWYPSTKYVCYQKVYNVTMNIYSEMIFIFVVLAHVF